MPLKGVLPWLCAGGLALGGCGGGGAAAPGCRPGQGCGGDGGPDATGDAGPTAACGKIQPCGGDVVGSWMFVEECESGASVAAMEANFASMAAASWCVGQTLVGIELLASGSLVFDAAGTYALDLTFDGTLDINLPADCLAGLSCDETTAGLQSQIDAGTYQMPNVSHISCSGSSSCLCRATVGSSRSETGTYATAGSVVAFTADSGAINGKSYCVAGNALHILTTTTGSTGQIDIASDLLAMKP